jgi:hypothetical protein
VQDGYEKSYFFNFLTQKKIFPGLNFWIKSLSLKKYIIFSYLNQSSIAWYLDGHIHGKEVVDPTADFRLVQYCCSIPETLFENNGRGKFIYKEMMRHKLPKSLIEVGSVFPQSYDSFHRVRNDFQLINFYKKVIADPTLDKVINKKQLINEYDICFNSPLDGSNKLPNPNLFLRKLSLIFFFLKKKGIFVKIFK